MTDVDALAVAKATALAALDNTPSSIPKRTKRRRRRQKALSNAQNQLQPNGPHTTHSNDVLDTEFEQTVVNEVLEGHSLTEELQREFAGVFRRFGGGKNIDNGDGEQLVGEKAVGNGAVEQGGTNVDENDEKNASEPESEDEEDLGRVETDNTSRKQRKERQRNMISNLKSLATKPEVVEAWDVTAADPVLLAHLKSVASSVVVPDNWRHKRKYLQGKRGMEKRAFKLPAYIADTGIGELRDAQIEADEKKSLKQKQREKMRAKTGRGVEIDVGRFYDAFFKFQTKPRLTRHGDVYYELRELEVDASGFVPGVLSEELRAALGIGEKSPPPWLVNMQRYGPPPGYPGLKVPGVNCEIPEGARFGYQAGGWGKPPVDENGRPIYGDVFGEGIDYDGRDKRFALSEKQKAWLWGEVEENGDQGISLSTKEIEREKDDEEQEGNERGDEVGREEETRGAENAFAREEEIEMNRQEVRKGLPSGQLYRVLDQQEASVGRREMMGSSHVYKVERGEEADKDLGGRADGREEAVEGEKRKREDGGDGKRIQKKQREFKF